MTSPLMHGFPPTPQSQVTLANWRTAPFNQWAFHHVREIVPSAGIPNDPAGVWQLPRAPADLPVREFIAETDTDALVVLHRGRIAFEHYANGMSEDTPHILMSVSKAMLGLLAGVLADRGILDLERPVTDVIPELEPTAYRGATTRQLLDMRAGIAFDEDYLAASGPIVEYRKATGWNPLGPGETASDLRSFYQHLTGSSGPHGGRFDYISPNTDLLGWVIERSAGKRYADLMSELLWKPLGAERSGYITVDRLGAPRCAGGMCVTVRDLARVGQLVLQGGVRDGKPVLPRAWLDDIAQRGDAAAWDAGRFAREIFPGLPMRYRAKWYVLDAAGQGARAAPLLFGWGIHGQHLFVDRHREMVVAKFSSQALPVDVALTKITLRAVAELGETLAG